MGTEFQTLSQKHPVEPRNLNISLRATPNELELIFSATPPSSLAWRSVSPSQRRFIPGAGSEERLAKLSAAIAAFQDAFAVGINSTKGISAFLGKGIRVDNKTPGDPRSKVRVRFVNPVFDEGFAPYTERKEEKELMDAQHEAKRLIAGTMTQIEREKSFEERKRIFNAAEAAIVKLEEKAKPFADRFAVSREMQELLPRAQIRTEVAFKAELRNELRARHGPFAQRLGLIKSHVGAYKQLPQRH